MESCVRSTKYRVDEVTNERFDWLTLNMSAANKDTNAYIYTFPLAHARRASLGCRSRRDCDEMAGYGRGS